MVVLGCLGLILKKKAKLGNDSVKKTSNEDEHAIIGYNFRGPFNSCGKNQLLMVDVKSARVRKVSGLGALRGDRIRLGNSCNGLILLIPNSPSSIPYSAMFCVIFNPKSNQIVKRITPPVWFSYVIPVAFFYHPLAKEYRTLNMVNVGGTRYEYHIYLFGSNTWRAALNPFFPFFPHALRPTCTKQALFWCSTSDGKIAVFDIISEEFCKKPYPVCGGKEKELHTPPTLVAKNNEESLCCCYLHRAELSIDVWVLEDYANWSWNRKYVVDLNWCKTDRYPSEAWRAYATGVMGRVKVVCIQKDELVFCYKDDGKRSMYSYHLVSGFSVRTKLSKTDWKKYTKVSIVDSREQEWYLSMFLGFVGL